MKVAINGLGRIGKLVLKIGLEKGLDIVAVNDLTDAKTLAYLLKYDSSYGRYGQKVEAGDNFIKIGNKKVRVFAEPDPIKLPWKDLKIDVVVECTGIFKDREKAQLHLDAGAKRVLISAPSKGPDKTIVLGVNDQDLKKEDKIISMASCTTNCLAPMAKVLHDNFGIKKGFMTTVHAYTNDQKILDLPHKKLRRARAAGVNIIPTSSGATDAVVEVIPGLKGKLDGLALRVPVPVGSIVDFVAELNREVTVEEINAAMKKAASKELKGIMEYCEDEIVSSDVIKNPSSSIFDATLTQILGDGKSSFVKTLAWYDNEYGYSNRLVDLIKKLK